MVEKEREYWKNVILCGRYIGKVMEELGMRFMFNRDMFSFWVHDNQIKANGAIALEFEGNCYEPIRTYKDTFPISFYTPYGESNFIKRKIGISNYTAETKEKLENILKQELGLVWVKNQEINGTIFSVYSITKFPWDQEISLPIFEDKCKEEYVTYEEVRSIFKGISTDLWHYDEFTLK